MTPEIPFYGRRPGDLPTSAIYLAFLEESGRVRLLATYYEGEDVLWNWIALR